MLVYRRFHLRLMSLGPFGTPIRGRLHYCGGESPGARSRFWYSRRLKRLQEAAKPTPHCLRRSDGVPGKILPGQKRLPDERMNSFQFDEKVGLRPVSCGVRPDLLRNGLTRVQAPQPRLFQRFLPPAESSAERRLHHFWPMAPVGAPCQQRTAGQQGSDSAQFIKQCFVGVLWKKIDYVTTHRRAYRTT
jgi:hypothetical protein